MKMNKSEGSSYALFGSSTFHRGTAGLFICNLIVNFPANVYVAWLIVGKGAVASELFAFNLAISEIIFCLSTIYMSIHIQLRLDLLAGAVLFEFFLTLMFVSRPIFHSSICLERYLAVVHPTIFLRFKPLRYKLGFCAVTWLLVLVFCTVSLFSVSYTESMYQSVGQSVVFLLLMSYCGVRILCVLKQPGPGDGQRHQESQNHVKRKAFSIIAITLLFTCSTELFQILLTTIMLLDVSREFTAEVSLTSLGIGILSGTITALLYLHRDRKLPCISECG